MRSKRCSKCGFSKDRQEDFFRRSGKNAHLPRSYCKECERKGRKFYDSAHPDKVKQWDKNGHIRYQYGLSPEDYKPLMGSTSALCEICQQKKRLVIDHDHSTGMIRGLLCHDCNAALGIFGDTEEGLMRAINYLRENT